MDAKRMSLLFGLVSLALATTPAAQPVIKMGDAERPLAQRWQAAQGEASQRGLRTGWWLGYSIIRRMAENSHIGSFSRWPDNERITLGELLTGIKIDQRNDEEVVQEFARTTLAEKHASPTPGRMVEKDLAFLFLFKPSGEKWQIERIAVSNLDLQVDLDGLPLLWLGKAGTAESLDLVEGLYRGESAIGQKKKLIFAMSVHDLPDRVLAILRGILMSDTPVELRKQAAFWLGQQGSPQALQLLLHAVKTDRDAEIREQAVFAVSRFESDAGTRALIELAQNSADRAVRKKAIFWLGQKNTPQSLEVLVGLAGSQDDGEIREQAVFAISRLDDKEALQALIDLAKNSPSEAVRKKAIFWLGQKAGKKATAALADFAGPGKDTQTQLQAVFALSQLPHDQGIPRLIDIATTHPDPAVRKKAIFWLGQSGDPRAIDVLARVATTPR